MGSAGPVLDDAGNRMPDRGMPGHRLGEIDLEHGTVDVRWRLVRRMGIGLLRLPSTKSGKGGERVIPLRSWAVMML
jgi:hypothetical protein